MPNSPTPQQNRPLVAVGPDIRDGRVRVSAALMGAIDAAGGAGIILPPDPTSALQVLDRCDALILTGGDDPRMEPFGVQTDARAVLVHPDRQALDLALIASLEERPTLPVLAICLGMQYLGLAAGGTLHQHLPDVLDSAAEHLDNTRHPVEGAIGSGHVVSHHRQALESAGSMDVIARSPDGVIEAICHGDRPWVRGVQWHPERMGDTPLGRGLFRRLLRPQVSEA
ncbi:MAG: gamma-glutamyl-gamma-aminobutyrate hydrolase family protein [Phycisphaerales bacterium]|nr:gamma-glutamyl-gamma-aminobutyrate hydrolase family protein [Phycisphaerales bacterium]